MNKCLYCYKTVDEGLDFHVQCSSAFFGSDTPPIIPYALKEMADLAKEVVERSISVPGVQPKLSMSVVKEKGHDKRLTVVGGLGGNYIFKPPSSKFNEMPENEHLTMKMAKLFGIEVVPNSLIRLASGELSYLTKRIDRGEKAKKIHMIDMFQILEAFDKYRSSLERIGKAINSFASNTLLDQLRFFEINLFSYLTGNNDMHLKNFSMMKTDYGWALSPAYDLLNVAIVNPDDTEEFVLTIGGRKKRIVKRNLTHFGTGLGLSEKQITGVYSRFLALKKEAIGLVENSFLSKKMQREYISILKNRYALIEEKM